MSKVNWSKAVQDYISNETMSYEKIAKKYKVSRTTVANKASEEDWPLLRIETMDLFKVKLIEIVVDIKIKNLLKELRKKGKRRRLK